MLRMADDARQDTESIALHEVPMPRDEYLLDVRRVIEEDRPPRAEAQRHDVAMLPSAAREEAEQIAAELRQMPDERPARRAEGKLNNSA